MLLKTPFYLRYLVFLLRNWSHWNDGKDDGSLSISNEIIYWCYDRCCLKICVFPWFNEPGIHEDLLSCGAWKKYRLGINMFYAIVICYSPSTHVSMLQSLGN